MNYLGHAYLSFGNAGILTGNIMGDHIKGRLILDKYPEEIRKGILLHRKIDEFCDNHTATQRAKILFKETYRLYSGAILDTLYDHFLANDGKLFPTDQMLLQFSIDTYHLIETQKNFLHPVFATYFPYMQQQNWLLHYRNLMGMTKSLQGLQKRSQNIPPLSKAFEIFVSNYYFLNQCYLDIIDDLIAFSKTEIERIL